MESRMVRKLRNALMWCGASDDFQVGGKARKGWEKLCVPLLQGKSEKRHCCAVGCPKDAEFEIYYEGAVRPDDSISTDACSEHVSELLTDAPCHYIYAIER